MSLVPKICVTSKVPPRISGSKGPGIRHGFRRCRTAEWAARKVRAVGARARLGLSWQIAPHSLTEALAAGRGEAKRAFEAMMQMKKINIAMIEAARGDDVDTTG